MEPKVSPWPLAFKYGLILGIAGIIISLVTYLINPTPDMDKGSSLMGFVEIIIQLVIYGYILYLAATARRTQDLDGYMSYGQSLGFMVITALPATIITFLYLIVFFNFISPEMIDITLRSQEDAMVQKGLSDEEIERQMGYVRMFAKPIWYTLFGGLGAFFFFLIISLITSIFAQKKNKQSDIA